MIQFASLPAISCLRKNWYLHRLVLIFNGLFFQNFRFFPVGFRFLQSFFQVFFEPHHVHRNRVFKAVKRHFTTKPQRFSQRSRRKDAPLFLNKNIAYMGHFILAKIAVMRCGIALLYFY